MNTPPAGLKLRGLRTAFRQIEEAEKLVESDLRYTWRRAGRGKIPSVGRRMIEGAAKKIVDQFFAAAAEE